MSFIAGSIKIFLRKPTEMISIQMKEENGVTITRRYKITAIKIHKKI